MAVNEAGVEQYDNIAVGDLGTQLFHFDDEIGKFKYALPVTAGAEFGGDTESYEAPETDLDYVPKVGGRRSINDIAYTINYTKDKYAQANKITDPVDEHTYMEVMKDGSAMIFKGTCAMPSITAGDVRQISMTIIPSHIKWVSNIYDLQPDDIDSVVEKLLEKVTITVDKSTKEVKRVKIDISSIPTSRQKYFVSENFVSANTSQS